MNNIVSKIVDELLFNGYFVTDFRRAIKRNIEQIASTMQRDYDTLANIVRKFQK